MKKNLIIIIMMIFSFFVIGCTENHELILEIPSNLRVENNIAKWNLVDKADGYVLYVSGDEYSVNSNYFDLNELKLINGNYVLKVKAVSKTIGVVNSEYSEEFIYIYEAPNVDPGPNPEPNTPSVLNIPNNLIIENSILKWDAVNNASGYIVNISGVDYTVNICELNLHNLLLGVGSYNIKVKAIGDGENYLESSYSNVITYKIENEEVVTVVQERYMPKQTANGLEYDKSVSVDDKLEYYYFYLGAINNVPISVYPSVKFISEDQEYTVERTNTTEEKIIETISLATEFIDMESTTVTDDCTVSFEGGVDEYVVALFTLSETVGHHYTKEQGRNIVYSNEHTKEIANTISENVSVKTVLSEKKGQTIGKFYRAAVYSNIDVFVVVERDLETGEYKYKYETFINDKNNLNIVIEESDSNGGFLNSSVEDNLKFDMDKAIAYIETIGGAEYQTLTQTTAEAREKGFDYGQGTVDDPYIIGGKIKNTYEQFLLISNNLDKHFKLMKDIDLSEYKESGFSSIIKGKFEGTIDGNDKQIYGFKQSLTYQNVNPSDLAQEQGYKYSLAIFECIGTNGVIKNLTVKDSSIYFDPYHDRDDMYAFGILSGICSGTIDNVKFESCSVTAHRAYSDSGIACARLQGICKNLYFNNCSSTTNGDFGMVAGKNVGTIQDCTVSNANIYFYFVDDHEASVGGIAGYSSGRIQDCIVNNSKFKSYHADDWYVFPFSRGHYSPKMGYIVGHAQKGSVYRVGTSNNTKELEHGHSGDYWFTYNDEKIGYNDGADTK